MTTPTEDQTEPLGSVEQAQIDKLLAKFRKRVQDLNRIMEDLRTFYPDANYYLAADSFHAMKGPSHDDQQCKPLHENSLDYVTLWHSGGGDW
jgi:hypothetical protein